MNTQPVEKRATHRHPASAKWPRWRETIDVLKVFQNPRGSQPATLQVGPWGHSTGKRLSLHHRFSDTGVRDLSCLQKHSSKKKKKNKKSPRNCPSSSNLTRVIFTRTLSRGSIMTSPDASCVLSPFSVICPLTKARHVQSPTPSAQEMAGHGLSTLHMWDMCPVVFLDLAAVLGPSITGQQWRRAVANCGQHVKSGRTPCAPAQVDGCFAWPFLHRKMELARDRPTVAEDKTLTFKGWDFSWRQYLNKRKNESPMMLEGMREESHGLDLLSKGSLCWNMKEARSDVLRHTHRINHHSVGCGCKAPEGT